MSIELTVPLLEKFFENRRNVLVYGQHGIGKTEMVKAALYNIGYKEEEVGYFSAPTVDPALALTGIPTVTEDVNGEKVIRTISPEMILKYRVLFFDELNRAPKDVLNALFEIIQNGTINGSTEAKIEFVVGAINPPTDEYTTEILDQALRDRFHVFGTVSKLPNASVLNDLISKNEIIMAAAQQIYGKANLAENIKELIDSFTDEVIEYMSRNEHYQRNMDNEDILSYFPPRRLYNLIANLISISPQDLDPGATIVFSIPTDGVDDKLPHSLSLLADRLTKLFKESKLYKECDNINVEKISMVEDINLAAHFGIAVAPSDTHLSSLERDLWMRSSDQMNEDSFETEEEKKIFKNLATGSDEDKSFRLRHFINKIIEVGTNSVLKVTTSGSGNIKSEDTTGTSVYNYQGIVTDVNYLAILARYLNDSGIPENERLSNGVEFFIRVFGNDDNIYHYKNGVSSVKLPYIVERSDVQIIAPSDPNFVEVMAPPSHNIFCYATLLALTVFRFYELFANSEDRSPDQIFVDLVDAGLTNSRFLTTLKDLTENDLYREIVVDTFKSSYSGKHGKAPAADYIKKLFSNGELLMDFLGRLKETFENNF